MQTIGQILKSARVRKKYSLKSLEEITKIKSGFIDAVEKQKWDSLPPFPTVLGFVKSISTALNIDENVATATLKRDYPPKKLNINPKPDVSSKFAWSPKLTFITGVALAVIAVAGYLVFQYFRFVSPPGLAVSSPKENQVVTGSDLLVFGSTDSDAKITVNNQPVIVNDDGKFSVDIGVSSETKEIKVVATSRSGKSTTISRRIVVQ